MPDNSAAVLSEPYGRLEVVTAPYTAPLAGEIVIRNRAIAVNPLDSVKQSTGNLMYGWLPYPSVLGEDVAGEVVEVGAGVTRFAVGDRVLGYAVGMEKKRNHRAEGGFQLYTLLSAALASPLPPTMDFADGAVFPLAVSTAAAALFQADQLGLRHPGAGTGGVVVVWGGSTSVGSNAIQLAAAAGYVVVTTASPRNHDALRRLGATHVLDRASATVIADVTAVVGGMPVAGVFAVGTGSAQPALAIAVATGARRVSLASPSVALETLPRRRASVRFIGMMAQLVAGTSTLMIASRLRGIRTRFVWGSTLMANEVGPMLWERFLPVALADGRYQVAPEPLVVGTGLESVQGALDSLREGVSARKLVVTLQ